MKIATTMLLVLGFVILEQRGARAQSPTPLCVDPERPRIVITLPQMPASRTFCTLDALGGSDSATLEWDPLRAGSLTRSTTLAIHRLSVARGGQSSCALANEVPYQLSCFSEAARHAFKPEENFAWVFEGLAYQGATPFLRFQPYKTALPHVVPVKFTELEQIDSSAFEAAVQQRPPASLSRSFGVLSEGAASELFQVIAEVVTERVRSKGMKLLEGRLKNLVCNEFVRPTTRVVAGAKVTPTDGTPVLPRTCDAVRSVRFEDLAGAARQIVDAITQDFTLLGISELFGHAPQSATNAARSIIEMAVEIAFESVRGEQEGMRGAGQRLMVALSHVSWPSSPKGAADLQRMVRFAFGAISECHRSTRCDASRVASFVNEPELYFAKSSGLAGDLTAWPEVASFISRGTRILAPPPEITEIEQARAAFSLLFDILDLYADQAAVPGGPRVPLGRYYVEWHEFSASHSARLRLARELLNAALQHDVPQVVTAGSRLALTGGDWKDSVTMRRVALMGGALGSYVSTYSSGQRPSDAELKARHDARKAAIGSLIDTQTERRHRLGDSILSLGSSLGLMAGFAAVEGGTRETNLQLQPSLSVALAYDCHRSDALGFHAEFAPLNLGNYAVYREHVYDAPTSEGRKEAGTSLVPPSPADALSPSITIGGTILVKEVDLLLLVGATVGYSLKLGDAEARANRALYGGLVLGAYVPILDFN